MPQFCGVAYVKVKSTLGEFLEMWLKDLQNQIGIKTRAEYDAIVRRPPASLATVQLDKLTTLNLQRYYREAQEGGGKNGQGLSARTLLHHHRLLAHALSTAIAWQLIQRNPADHVETPRPKRADQKTLSVEQVAAVLKAAEVTAGRRAFKGTKTEQVHTVTLPPDVIDTIVDYRRQQTHDLGAQELDFPTETGGIYHPD